MHIDRQIALISDDDWVGGEKRRRFPVIRRFGECEKTFFSYHFPFFHCLAFPMFNIFAVPRRGSISSSPIRILTLTRFLCWHHFSEVVLVCSVRQRRQGENCKSQRGRKTRWKEIPSNWSHFSPSVLIRRLRVQCLLSKKMSLSLPHCSTTLRDVCCSPSWHLAALETPYPKREKDERLTTIEWWPAVRSKNKNRAFLLEHFGESYPQISPLPFPVYHVLFFSSIWVTHYGLLVRA